MGAFLLVFLQPLDVGSAQTHGAGSESDGAKKSASAPPVDGVDLYLQLCGCLADGDQVGSVFGGPGLDDADRAALQGNCATFRRMDDDVRAHGSGRFLLCGLFGAAYKLPSGDIESLAEALQIDSCDLPFSDDLLVHGGAGCAHQLREFPLA